MRSRKPAFFTVVMSGLLTIAAAQPASAAVSFCANLSGAPYPDGAYSGKSCQSITYGPDAYATCTWIEDAAFNRTNQKASAKARATGTIHKVKLIAGAATTLRLYIARYKPATPPGQARAQGSADHHHGGRVRPELHHPIVRGQHLGPPGRLPGLDVDLIELPQVGRRRRPVVGLLPFPGGRRIIPHRQRDRRLLPAPPGGVLSLIPTGAGSDQMPALPPKGEPAGSSRPVRPMRARRRRSRSCRGPERTAGCRWPVPYHHGSRDCHQPAGFDRSRAADCPRRVRVAEHTRDS